MCSNPSKTDGAACTDGSACTTSDSCQAGACVGASPVVCTAKDACHDAGTCDPASGACSNPAKVDGAACSDNLCLSGQTCTAGACGGGTPVNVDDEIACTIDSCDPATGVKHRACSTLDRTVGTTLYDATKFLFTGNDPIQTGVSPGTIDALRITVLRGKVKTAAGDPLSGVTVHVVKETASAPDFGQTLTAADGFFTMAANGGGELRVSYSKTGFLPVERKITAPLQDYVILPDVVMLAPDAVATIINSNGAATQVHRASVMSDSRGSRQATLIFLPGTTAQLIFPNDSGQSIQQLTVRATEHTVGPLGPDAMPLLLPPTSGYTYAIGLNADEAVAAGAKRVDFSQPVSLYLENFLGFPTGLAIPHGFSAKDSGCWKPEQDGRVIKILDVQGGAAVLDTDGDGLADNAAALAALGIDPLELVKLAELYQPGQSLWRITTSHFSELDGNEPAECQNPPCDKPPKKKKKPCGKDSEDSNASVVLCQRQTLTESVAVVGTPYTLSYASDRVPGRLADRSRIISLTDASPPAGLKRILFNVDIAGRHFSESFICPADCGPNKTRTFTWDGTDVFGRSLQGGQRAVFTIGYVYDGFYTTPAAVAASFGLPGGSSTSVPSAEVIVTTTLEDFLGPWDARADGLGGWSLDVHDVYDTTTHTVHGGDGHDRQGETVSSVITTISGGQPPGAPVGDGGPATAAGLKAPAGIHTAKDGAIFFADDAAQRIRKIDKAGIITTVAGNGLAGFSGDGGPATAATLTDPIDVAVAPDGTICIADFNNQRVRCVDKDTGVITTRAGNGQRDFYGDGGPAAAAALKDPAAVAFGPDCALYIGEWNHVRRVGPDGIITTVAGGGANNPPAKGTDIFLGHIEGLAFGPDGGLYISDAGAFFSFMRVLRLATDGRITRFAGTGTAGDTGDGGPAVDAEIHTPRGVAVAPDGSVYVQVAVADPGPPVAAGVRRIGPDGIISRFTGSNVLGCDNNTYCGEGGPVGRAHLLVPYGVAAGPPGDNSIYVADHNGRVVRARLPLPGLSLDDVAIPSEDGGQLLVFTGAGKHKSTRDTTTGATLYSFAYDAAGRLATVTDVNGLVTTVAHDGGGNPLTITGPYGQETLLATDANGFVSSITNPNNESSSWTYTAGGLLQGRTDARGFSTSYSYDALGRVALVHDAVNTDRTFAHTDLTNGFSVKRTTPEGRITTFEVLTNPDGSLKATTTSPAGLASIFEDRFDEGSRKLTRPDGEVVTTADAPDPRFGLLAPVTTTTTKTPLGLTRKVAEERLVTLADAADPFSVTTVTEKTTVNGKLSTRVYDAATKTWTTTTPMGRISTVTLDAVGRTTQAATSGLTAVSFGYDAQGRLTTTTQGTRMSTVGYDLSGWLATSTDALSQTVTLGRDGAGRVTATTRPDTQVIASGFDKNGNLTSVTPPGRPAHALAYDKVNLLADYLPPDAGFSPRDTQWSHDGDREVSAIVRPDGLVLGYGYDAAGRLALLTAPSETRTHSYSGTTGQLLSVVTPAVTLSYAWDGSLMTSMTWSGAVSGSVELVHDNDFRVSMETVDAGGPVSIQYDLDSLVSQAGDLAVARSNQNALVTGTTLDQVTDSYTYSGFGELASYEALFGANSLYKMVFERDELGRVTKKTETLGGVPTVFAYAYDLAGRLKEVKENGSIARSYGYDANGNRLAKTDGAGGITGSYDDQDRLITYGALNFTYTKAGELSSKYDSAKNETTTYFYDVFGNLASVTCRTRT